MSKELIARFGGIEPMAEKLSAVPGAKRVAPTTVRYWAECGYIPSKRHPEIIKAAQIHGIEIRDADFVNTGPPQDDGGPREPGQEKIAS